MNPKIHRLSESVINQIAAGEVVENPASVLKELIENSLDAGAQNILIEIEGGGRDFLSIEDDGSGMGPEDALACLERHATSKIRSAEDLSALTTMGFRGEALAAIAAVSHFDLQTSVGGVGTSIHASGGKVESVQPIARNRGTRISIRSLFFNVPARKKFQKSVSADAAALHRVVETMALSRPDVAFSLKSRGKILLDVQKQGLEMRLEAILGPFPHKMEAEGMVGFLSAPSEAKINRKGQWLFINQRPLFLP